MFDAERPARLLQCATLQAAQKDYHAGEKELLAVVHALRLWHCYLSGVHFTVVTDHHPNTYFDTKTVLSPRQVRWMELLSRYSFDWKYNPGRTNVADPLSRRPRGTPHKQAVAAEAAATARTMPAGEVFAVLASLLSSRPKRKNAGQNLWRQTLPGEDDTKSQENRTEKRQAERESAEQRTHKRTRHADTADARSASPARTDSGAASGLPPPPPLSDLSLPEAIKVAYLGDRWFKNWSRKKKPTLHAESGLYYHAGRVVVPAADGLRFRVVAEHHETRMYGHFGTRKTYGAVAQNYWWPGLHRFVAAFCKACDACQRNKPLQRRPAGLLQPPPVPSAPWNSISTDLITGLPPTDNGHDAIVVFVDRLTKMVHFRATRSSLDTRGYAQLFLDTVVCLHGVPAEIVSDRGPQFTSQLWRDLTSLLSVSHALSSAYHPQTDGQTERANRVLEEMLRAYVGPMQNDWDQMLSMAEFAVNSAWHESTQTSPFFLNYGRHLQTPATHGLPNVRAPAAAEMAEKIQDGIERAKRALEAAQRRQKRYADTRRSEASFQEGEEVLLSTINLNLKAGGGVRKLMPLYVGPFKIEGRVGAVAYRLALPDTMKQLHPVFHVSLLRRYNTRPEHAPTPVLPVLEHSGGDWFAIEAVLDCRESRGRREYLVKWQGFRPEHNEWRDESDLTENAVKEYWDQRRREARPHLVRTGAERARTRTRARSVHPRQPRG